MENKTETKEKVVTRVDNRPASIYSMVVFLLVFTAFYIFYPQISMYIPFAGDKYEMQTDYVAASVEDMQDAPIIITARCIEKGKTEKENGNALNIYKNVEFETAEAIRGGAGEIFILKEWGGSTLLDNGGTRKKKFIISYADAAEFEEGKTYLLFLNTKGEVINGKYGAIKANDDGTFTDVKNKTYSAQTLKDMLGGK